MASPANAGHTALTSSPPQKKHCHPRPKGRSRCRFLQLYCNDPVGPVVVFVPSAFIPGHVPPTPLAVVELLSPTNWYAGNPFTSSMPLLFFVKVAVTPAPELN
jgi:hypothetical protein